MIAYVTLCHVTHVGSFRDVIMTWQIGHRGIPGRISRVHGTLFTKAFSMYSHSPGTLRTFTLMVPEAFGCMRTCNYLII